MPNNNRVDSGNDYVAVMESKEAQCALLEQQARDEYERLGKHSKKECIYLQQAANLRHEMANMSTGSTKYYQIQKMRDLNMRITQIVAELDPELLRKMKKSGNSASGAATGGSAGLGTGKAASPAAKRKQAAANAQVNSWYKEMPKQSFEDISGMTDLKAKLRECISDKDLASLREYLGMRKIHSFFLFGPPGCGKTYIAEAFAHELCEKDYKFLSLKGSDILSKYVGEAEKIVTRLFEEAIACKHCIVFIDEIDGVCKNRSLPNLPEYASSITTAFLEGYNAINKAADEQDDVEIIFIGATNYPGKVDNAMLDRVELIKIPLPDKEARESAFERSFKEKITFEEDCSFGYMAQQTEGYNYRDIDRLTMEMKNQILRAVMRKYGDEKAALNALREQRFKADRELFELSRKDCLPSPKEDILRELETWERNFRSGMEE